MNRFKYLNYLEFNFPNLDPEFVIVTAEERQNNKFNDERLSHLTPIKQFHYGEFVEFATFFSYDFTMAYIIGPAENAATLYKKSREMADKINTASKILNSPYHTHTPTNEGESKYAIFRIIISEHKFDLFGSEYLRLHREFANRIEPWKTYSEEYFIAFQLKNELSERWLNKMRELNPNIDSLPDDTYISISDKKYKRLPFYVQPSYKSIVKSAIVFGSEFAGECTPERVDGYIGVTELPNGQWITDDTKIFYVKVINNI